MTEKPQKRKNGMAAEIEKLAVSGHLSPPRWMSRPEKHDFHRVIEARKAVGNPVLRTEYELLVDHVECRSRLAALRTLLRRALRDAKDYAPSEKHAANLILQMNSTTSLSRRLARELGLSAATRIPEKPPAPSTPNRQDTET
ncbi:hypothetical protein [Bradyrhizobium lablabi]|uniref:hypothetical protein n=1 Tax=Bradyrhizobium lablabi TaxID=722472 RepID=UPI0009A748D8|nr:hypothetical protein [Bradyrhizobium lablabi]